jgi:hypothetical protein
VGCFSAFLSPLLPADMGVWGRGLDWQPGLYKALYPRFCALPPDAGEICSTQPRDWQRRNGAPRHWWHAVSPISDGNLPGFAASQSVRDFLNGSRETGLMIRPGYMLYMGQHLPHSCRAVFLLMDIGLVGGCWVRGWAAASVESCLLLSTSYRHGNARTGNQDYASP